MREFHKETVHLVHQVLQMDDSALEDLMQVDRHVFYISVVFGKLPHLHDNLFKKFNYQSDHLFIASLRSYFSRDVLTDMARHAPNIMLDDAYPLLPTDTYLDGLSHNKIVDFILRLINHVRKNNGCIKDVIQNIPPKHFLMFINKRAGEISMDYSEYMTEEQHEMLLADSINNNNIKNIHTYYRNLKCFKNYVIEKYQCSDEVPLACLSFHAQVPEFLLRFPVEKKVDIVQQLCNNLNCFGSIHPSWVHFFDTLPYRSIKDVEFVRMYRNFYRPNIKHLFNGSESHHEILLLIDILKCRHSEHCMLLVDLKNKDSILELRNMILANRTCDSDTEIPLLLS